MKIVIFVDGCAPFEARSSSDEKLGPTEKAIIQLAESWQKMGHDLRVLTPASNPTPSLPLYLPQRALPQIGPVDLLVVVREWRAFFLDWKAKKKVFLALDRLSDFSTFGIADKRVLDKFDFLLCLDPQATDAFCEQSGFPKARIRTLRRDSSGPIVCGENEARELLQLV